jgi:hypothetical protein
MLRWYCYCVGIGVVGNGRHGFSGVVTHELNAKETVVGGRCSLETGEADHRRTESSTAPTAESVRYAMEGIYPSHTKAPSMDFHTATLVFVAIFI